MREGSAVEVKFTGTCKGHNPAPVNYRGTTYCAVCSGALRREIKGGGSTAYNPDAKSYVERYRGHIDRGAPSLLSLCAQAQAAPRR